MSRSLDSLNIPDKTKHYVKMILNPLLEDLVTKLIRDQPENPAQYMYDLLGQVSGVHAALEREVARLKNDLVALKTREETRPIVEEEEVVPDDDDDCEEVEVDEISTTYMNRSRTAVSAEAYGEWNKKSDDFAPPVFPKTDEQRMRITEMLSKSFLFNTLDHKDFDIIIDAIEEVVIDPNTRVITQGEMGDFLFVIEKGVLNCLKRFGEEENIVKVCEPGDVFGELSLLYNAPRAASVESVTECVLWKLDRATFTQIVRSSASRKRDRYEAFLKSVPLLSKVGTYELSQIADALRPQWFDPDTLIVQEGDPGDTFYIIEEGTADAFKSSYHVLHYDTPGEYFGELSLLRNEPRAASVRAGPEGCRALLLDRRSFQRLLGNLDELLKREYQKSDDASYSHLIFFSCMHI